MDPIDEYLKGAGRASGNEIIEGVKGRLNNVAIHRRLTEIKREGRSQSVGNNRIYFSEDYMRENADILVEGSLAKNCSFSQQILYPTICIERCYRFRSCRYNLKALMDNRGIDWNRRFGHLGITMPSRSSYSPSR